MRLSVIIPGYNTLSYQWARCLNSILSAIGSDDQVICVDDASPCSEGFDLIEQMTTDPRVVFLRQKRNGGAAEARNVGLALATGQYVTFVDSDDEVIPGVYEECLRQAGQCKCDITIFGVRVIWAKESLCKDDVLPSVDFGVISPTDVKRLFEACLLEYPWNKIYRAGFLKEHDIRFNPGVCPGEDTAFNLECLIARPRVSIVGKIGYIYYRYDGTSLSRAYPELRRTLEFRTDLWRRYKALVPHARETFGAFGEYDEVGIARAEWENMWRRGSQSTLMNRWQFLSVHPTQVSRRRIVEFIYRLVFAFMRRHFYFRPIRRWHVRRLFPNVKEWRDVAAGKNAIVKSFESIMNIPSPYRVYLFEELARQLRAKGCEFTAHFMAKGHGERPASWLNPTMGFTHRYWRDFSTQHRHFNPGFIIRSWFVKPNVLLVGSPFDTITGILAAFAARARVKCTWVEGQTKTPGRLDGFVGWFKRLVLSRFKFVAVPGSDAAKYIGLHQARTRRPMPTPVILPNLIDESRFKPRQEWPLADLEVCRKLFGSAADERVCLIPARLAEVKGLVPFVRALDVALVNAGWRIVILGQGSLKQAVLDAAVEKGIGGRLTILDYIPYEQMPICYAAADLMLLPSLHDPNPLSVPEALHSGLPVALSDQAGNVEEGVTVGRNGWRLPVKNPVAFKAVLAEIFATPKERLREMGECSKWENATFWDTEKAIARFLDQIGV